MQEATDAVVVYITVPSAEEAATLAHTLVAERLAACVNRLPVESVYHWQGAVEAAAEVLLIVKTRRALLDALAARVRALHSYTVPEIIALPLVAGWPPYLEWLVAETAPPAEPPH
ncbi:MAG TPA: divalent-cation tolerance protein CutA [Chloroflexota bacterium]|nr:divalent-cation tolerance protein CutA [Chloroflexota bacterium]